MTLVRSSALNIKKWCILLENIQNQKTSLDLDNFFISD